MEESRREKIFKMSAELVADIAVDFKRYLYSEVDWDCSSLYKGSSRRRQDDHVVATHSGNAES